MDESKPESAGTVAERKRALRHRIRARLAALTPPERSAGSAAIVRHIEGIVAERKPACVLTYAALPSEPDLGLLWRHEGDWLFPRVEGEDLSLWRVRDPLDLMPGAFGVMEPDPARCERATLEEVELVLLPGSAFDIENGARLGKGKGYYDRLLAQSAALHLGVGFEFQVLAGGEVPVEDHDRPVDGLVTEAGVRWIRPGNAGDA